MRYNLDDFSAMAQAVWNEPTFTGKQALMIEMIDACKSNNQKKAYFKQELGKMTNNRRIDRFAADLMLVDTDKRIR